MFSKCDGFVEFNTTTGGRKVISVTPVDEWLDQQEQQEQQKAAE